LLPRALQAVEGRQNHLALTVRFAALEFRSPNGDAERARTLFENLIAATPKKLDLWDQLVDLEMAMYANAKSKSHDGGEAEEDGGAADPAPVRAVFERAARMPKLKPRWTKAWFKKWAKWEEDNGDEKSRAMVSMRAREWIAAEEARKAQRGDEED
jgi:rRNA biogenesis protein RRP5